VLRTERAAEIADALMTDQVFNSINLTLICMQMLTNSFRSMIHSLNIVH